MHGNFGNRPRWFDWRYWMYATIKLFRGRGPASLCLWLKLAGHFDRSGHRGQRTYKSSLIRRFRSYEYGEIKCVD